MEFSSQRLTCLLCAGLSLKVVFITFATLRRRIVSGQFRPIEEDSHPVVGFIINYVAKAMLLVCPLGPAQEPVYELITAQDVEDGGLVSWLGAHRNAAEQEPFAAATAVAYSLVAGSAPSVYAGPMLAVYLASRVLHMLCQGLQVQPWRTIFFLASMAASAAFSVLTLVAAYAAAPLEPLAGACGILAAGLQLKVTLMTIGTVRCRIFMEHFVPTLKEDAESAGVRCIIQYLLKPLLAILPLGSTEATMTSWLNAHRNSAEQEPFFLAAALACGSSARGPSYLAVQLIYVFLACRVVHTAAYMLRLQPWRTISFLTALFAMVILCGITFQDASGLASQEKAVGILAAGLGLKNVVTTLATLRRRLVSGQFRSIQEDGIASVQFLVNYVAKAMLLVFPLGPSGAPADVADAEKGQQVAGEDAGLAAWLGIHRNSIEQESFVLMAALASEAVVAAPPAKAALLLYAFLAFRFSHMVSYALRAQPWRTLSFLAAVGSSVGFGVMAMAAALA